MPEPNSTIQNDVQVARINRVVSAIVGSVLLAVGGFVVFENREYLDRDELWADFWKEELSKPSGLPEFKGAVKTQFEGVKFDASALQPPTFEFDSSSFQPKANDTARANSRKLLGRQKSR